MYSKYFNYQGKDCIVQHIIDSYLFPLMKLPTLKKLQIRIWRLIWTFDNKIIVIKIYTLNNKNISKQLSCNHWLKEKQCKLNK
jgi:hypothetical protein